MEAEVAKAGPLNGELQGRRQVSSTNNLPLTLQLAVECKGTHGLSSYAGLEQHAGLAQLLREQLLGLEQLGHVGVSP